MPPERLNQRCRQLSWHVHGGLVLLLVLAACQGPPPGRSSEPTASAAISPGRADCPYIDVRTPRGTRIDLAGTWTTGSAEAGNQIVYELRQEGECLWGRVYSAYRGQDPGQSFDVNLIGIVRPDFTAEVDVLEIHVAGARFQYASFGRASATFAIRFEDVGGEERISLEIVALQARAVGPGALAIGPGALGGRLFATGGPIVGAVLTRSP